MAGLDDFFTNSIRLICSSYQDVKMLEGTTPIWLSVRHVDLWHYYLVSVYWASQLVGTLGMGDINVHRNEELLLNFVALFIAVIFRCGIMCRLWIFKGHGKTLLYRQTRRLGTCGDR